VNRVLAEQVKMIFKRALSHYAQVLEKLQEDKELDFSNDIFLQDIQNNVNKINGIIDGVDAPDDGQSILDKNRELLCCALQNYIDDLGKMKDLIKSKLQNSVPALPSFTFTTVDEEIALARRIQTSSCIEHGF
jgi:hypothetical protein